MAIAASASVALALVAIVVAILANGRASKANEIAKKANEHAEKANEHAEKANEIATEAVEQSKQVEISGAWDAVLMAASPLVSANPWGEPIAPMIRELRGRLQNLTHRLGAPDGFNEWWRATARWGLFLLNEMMEKPQPKTVDEYGRAHAEFARWASVFVQNLGAFRLAGLQRDKLAVLTEDAKQQLEAIARRNPGWTLADPQEGVTYL